MPVWHKVMWPRRLGMSAPTCLRFFAGPERGNRWARNRADHGRMQAHQRNSVDGMLVAGAALCPPRPPNRPPIPPTHHAYPPSMSGPTIMPPPMPSMPARVPPARATPDEAAKRWGAQEVASKAAEVGGRASKVVEAAPSSPSVLRQPQSSCARMICRHGDRHVLTDLDPACGLAHPLSASTGSQMGIAP